MTDTRESLLTHLKAAGSVSAIQARQAPGMDAKAVSKLIKSLLKEGAIIRTGNTRGTRYQLVA